MAKCDLCGKEFATDEALSQHLKDKHPSGSVPRSETRGEPRPKAKSLRRRNRHPVAIGIGIAAVILLVGLYFLAGPFLAAPPIPCSTGETYIHVHPYLVISIEGTNVTLPASIGFLQNGSCLEEMHTHDASGIIHIEISQTDTNRNYTLSDFFRVWNATYPTVTISGVSRPVTFSNSQIFGLKADSAHKLIVLVDGKPVSDGANVPLEQLDYCNSANGGVPPCEVTANGNPLWNGSSNYPYGTGHRIVIEYTSG